MGTQFLTWNIRSKVMAALGATAMVLTFSTAAIAIEDEHKTGECSGTKAKTDYATQSRAGRRKEVGEGGRESFIRFQVEPQ